MNEKSNYKLYLVQRAKFYDNVSIVPDGEPIISLDYMGSAEFEFGAVGRSFKEIMNEYDNYDLFRTGILHKNELDELLLFCRKDFKDDIVDILKKFCENPYGLKEFAYLAEETNLYDTIFTLSDPPSFWWEIDQLHFMCFFSGGRRKSTFLKRMDVCNQKCELKKLLYNI